MESKNIRDRLTLKTVELSHLDQFNELLRYVFQVTDSDIEKSGYEDEEEIIRSKRPLLRAAHVFGWFTQEDELISQVAVYPCEVNIHGKLYKMGCLTGVGTYPEYANKGLMKDLIKVALDDMRKNGQWISYLYPYSVPYYRHKGWEIMSNKRIFRIKDTQLPKKLETEGYVEREDIDHEDVIQVYTEFAKKTHGALLRNAIYWEEYWRWENEDEATAAIYYNKEDKPMGFCFYRISDEKMRLREMVYLNQEARRGLWQFISAHFSMINYVIGRNYKDESISFLLEDSQIEEKVAPYYMARIVDVREFIQAYPFSSVGTPFYLEITDPLVEWNTGIFAVEWNEKGAVTVSPDKKIGNPVRLTIQTLSTMMMSYKRPSYLHEIERLLTDKQTLKMLESIIPTEKAFFSDYL